MAQGSFVLSIPRILSNYQCNLRQGLNQGCKVRTGLGTHVARSLGLQTGGPKTHAPKTQGLYNRFMAWQRAIIAAWVCCAVVRLSNPAYAVPVAPVTLWQESYYWD